jgi:hypothetical protein
MRSKKGVHWLPLGLAQPSSLFLVNRKMQGIVASAANEDGLRSGWRQSTGGVAQPFIRADVPGRYGEANPPRREPSAPFSADVWATKIMAGLRDSGDGGATIRSAPRFRKFIILAGSRRMSPFRSQLAETTGSRASRKSITQPTIIGGKSLYKAASKRRGVCDHA